MLSCRIAICRFHPHGIATMYDTVVHMLINSDIYVVDPSMTHRFRILITKIHDKCPKNGQGDPLDMDTKRLG